MKPGGMDGQLYNNYTQQRTRAILEVAGEKYVELGGLCITI